MQRPDSFESRWPIYAWTSSETPGAGAPPVGFAGQSMAQTANVEGFEVDVPQDGIVRYIYGWAFDTNAVNVDVVNVNPLDALLSTFKLNNVSATGFKLRPLKSVAGDGVRPRHVYFPLTTGDKLLADFKNVRVPATIDLLHAMITYAICPPTWGVILTCKQCKTKNDGDSKYCKGCGKELDKG